MPMRRRLSPDSVVVAAGRPERTGGAPLNTPIVPASTYHHGGERSYQREGGPTTDAFEAALGELDGGSAIAYSAGTAAVSAVIGRLAIGARALVPASMYWGVLDLFQAAGSDGRLKVVAVDQADTETVLAALPGADLLWLEVASNPMLSVPELPRLLTAAKAEGALTCVDATFATPLLVRPLEHGADLVMHSATKFLSGHSDVLMGALVTADATLAGRLRAERYLVGSVPGVLESYLALRGLRTLAVRLERQQANATELARRLVGHDAVVAVRYPGAPGDLMHERWTAIASGPGMMLSFELADAAHADRFCERVELIGHATSLGGVESLVERRSRYEGERSMGTPEALVRLAVGIENVEDLWDDIVQALA
jgi:cystathionine gamma-synthase